MIYVLPASAVAVLQQAFAAAAGGDGAGAEAAIRRLPPEAQRHADTLFVLAKAMRAQGRMAEARIALERATAASPRNFRLWNSLGNLLDDMGETDAAIGALEKAVAIEPRYAEGWVNLGIVATGAGRLFVAESALARALALEPESGAALAALGALEQANGRTEAAVAAYRGALAANPGDVRSRHNLATTLRAMDEQEAALAELDRALADGAAGPQTATVRAHVLAELGRLDEAVDQYRAVLRAAPEQLDAQETLARLLPQIGRRGEALDGYRAALAGVTSPALWRSAIAAARDIGEGDEMLRWTGAATARHGDAPEFELARVSALTILGETKAAIAVARRLAAAEPGYPGVDAHLAQLLLKSGDVAEAERHALAATEVAPLDQSGWALLTLIWRLTGDARAGWLADYARLVMVAEVPAPKGWGSRETFLGDLAAALTALHVTSMAPAEQSLRGGSQTRGNLFERRDPAIAAFREAVRATVETCLATLPGDPSHPFLRRNTGRFAFAGSWSVRLRAQGFHVSHIHTSGWLSSAFYVSVPPEVLSGSGDAGRLLFGVPDATLGLDLPPRRIVDPLPGRLVLFPSYFWHGTAPFESAEPRLTAAFDALPG